MTRRRAFRPDHCPCRPRASGKTSIMEMYSFSIMSLTGCTRAFVGCRGMARVVPGRPRRMVGERAVVLGRVCVCLTAVGGWEERQPAHPLASNVTCRDVGRASRSEASGMRQDRDAGAGRRQPKCGEWGRDRFSQRRDWPLRCLAKRRCGY